MSLKMKFVASALALGATAVNAQSFDYRKEFAENPKGAPAVSCAAVFIFLAEVAGRNDPKFKAYHESASVPIAAADKAYGDPKITNNKTIATLTYFFQVLRNARSQNTEASYIEHIQGQSQICDRDFPKEVKLEAK